MDPQHAQASSHAQGNQQQMSYDTSQGGHYGACAALAAKGYAPADLYTGPWANVHQGLTGQYKDILTTYWQHTISHLENDTHDYKIHHLPLARIKKVMKADPEVKMISAEAPILFAKGCDIFITELTMRAWIHAEENKRRTLQRSDIASALSKSDMFDFLIDIVPREEASAHAKRNAAQAGVGAQGIPVAPPGAAPIPGQHGGLTQPQGHGAQPHQMGPGDYGLAGHGMGGEQDYRQPGMYPGQVQAAPGGAYGQAQPPMYGEIEGMYGYSTMQSQQVCPRNQDPSAHHLDVMGPELIGVAIQGPIPPEEFE